MSLVVRNLIQSLEEIDRLKYNILGYVTDLQRANEQIAQLRAEVAEYREALEFYACPGLVNASQHTDGGVNIWEGGGTDSVGTYARAVLAKFNSPDAHVEKKTELASAESKEPK
jgi:hypothetical protein